MWKVPIFVQDGGDGCNEWIQTSNPATETKITGFLPVRLSFKSNGHNNPWVGIGRKDSSPTLINDSPTQSAWYTAIGSRTYWSGKTTIPGPYSTKKELFGSALNWEF